MTLCPIHQPVCASFIATCMKLTYIQQKSALEMEPYMMAVAEGVHA